MDDGWEGVDEALRRFGLPAKHADRPAIVAALREQIRLETNEVDDQFLMRLLCAQLFSLGVVEDCLLVWKAKSCNFDTHCGIDVQFLCGAGLKQTKEFLRAHGSDPAQDALEYIAQCDCDFADFSVGRTLRQAQEFYRVA
ncbi:hypothetical protein [Nostoc sp. DSM 114167]|jgi:hypothetical protein|uniref:hypothetical protein n=1 Tax=Nostoc sp. DSM 114167 TaxID=3439050 RepID=UPI0040465745